MKKYRGSHERLEETEKKLDAEGAESSVQKPEKKKGRIMVRTLLVLAVIIALVMGGGYAAFSHYTSKLNYVPREEEAKAVVTSTPPPVSEEHAEELASIDDQLRASLEEKADWDFTGKNVTNILLIGVDNDYTVGMNDRGNADGLIIVSINKDTKQLILTSILRDLYVAVPEHGYNTKITLSYHYAGTETLINTIENSFGIPIDNYVLVNYLNIIEIVDAVGGLTLDVDRSELYFMQEKIQNLNLLRGMPVTDNLIDPDDEGTLTLNGVQVAAYMRVRLAGNADYERTERARRVLTGLIDKALEMDLSQINAMAETVLPKVTTDLDQGEIFSLLLNALTYMKYEMVSNRVPVDGTFYSANIAGSVVVADFKANSEYLYNLIYEGKTA